MATYYARTAGGNWNANTTWSSDAVLQAAGAAAAGTPTNADDVVRTAGSGAVTIPASTTAVCRSYDGNAAITALIFAATSSTLQVGDASGGTVRFGASEVLTLTGIGTINMQGTTGGTLNLTNNSAYSLPNLNVNVGTTTTVVFQTAIVSAGTITHTQGGLNSNDKSVTAAVFSSSNSNVRALTLGTSTVNLTGTGVAWSGAVGTNMTLSAAGSTITLSGAAAAFSPATSQSFGNVFLTGSGSASVNASVTFANLTRTGTATKTDILSIGTALFTVTGTFTVTGNSAINRMLAQSSAVGTARTITAGAVAFTNVDFTDITIAGAAAGAPVGTSVGDAGGNTGISFTPAVTQYANPGARLTGAYLRVPGTVNNYASTPDSVALSFTGDIDIRARVALDDWTPTSSSYIVSKFETIGAQRSWALFVQATDGKIAFQRSSDGAAAELRVSTVSPVVADGATLWVRVTKNNTTGVVTFYTADGSLTNPVVADFTQLGATVAGSTGVTTFDSTAAVEFGTTFAGTTGMLTGNIYRAQVRNGIDGTLVLDADFASQTADANTFSGGLGNTFTVNVGGFTWSDATKWTSRVPLPQDDVVISRVFAATPGITLDMPRLGKSITASGSSGTFNFVNSVSWTSYGSFTLPASVTFSGSGTVSFFGRGSHTITSAGATFNTNVTVGGPNGVYTLQDAFSTAGVLAIVNGATFTANGYSVTALTYSGGTTSATVINMGSGTWTITRTTAANVWSPSGSTVNPSTSTLVVSGASTATRTILLPAGPGNSLNALTYNVANSPGIVAISAATSGSTITALTVGSGRTVTLAGTLYTTNANIAGVVNGYLYLPGVTGQHASTPDSAALSVTGNIDIRVRVTLDNWTPAGIGALLSKWLSTGNQLSYTFQINTAGNLRLAASTDGSTFATQSSSVSLTTLAPVNGVTVLWLRATRRSSDGRVQFFTASGALTNPSSGDWTQLGIDRTDTVGAIFDSTADVYVGATSEGATTTAGKFYRAIIYSDLTETTKVLDADFTTKAILANTFTEGSANAATVTINGDLAKAGDGRIVLASTAAGTQANIYMPSNGVIDTGDYTTWQDLNVRREVILGPTVVSDDFSEADGTLVEGKLPDVGPAWLAAEGIPDVQSGALNAQAFASGYLSAIVETSTADHSVEATMVVTPANGVGLLVRYESAGNFYFFMKNNTSTLALWKRVGGASTQLTTVSSALVAGDVLRLTATGSLIQVRLNSKLILAYEDTSLLTGTKAGVYISTAGARVDDFSAKAVAAANRPSVNGDRANRLSNVTGLAFDFSRTGADTVPTVTDSSSTGSISRPRTGSDTALATDAATRDALALIRSVSDSAPSTDAASAQSTYTRTASDSAPASDATVRGALSAARTADDIAIATDDAVRGALVLPRTGDDTVTTTDLASTVSTYVRLGSDSAPATDSVVRIVSSSRTAVDAVGGTDVGRAVDRVGCVRLTTSVASGYVTLTHVTASGDVVLSVRGC